ncbi:uncharacterized protein LOC141911197 isoform X2 [Tubulanus polymorphus]|uniref:uncharacterized protein LOC141911197 isoform X2 n=1 Tax=Tubulanus polymorphus TaxID=672921 RepID=UPI003DA23F52
MYREAVKSGKEIPWKCIRTKCTLPAIPQAESTRLSLGTGAAQRASLRLSTDDTFPPIREPSILEPMDFDESSIRDPVPREVEEPMDFDESSIRDPVPREVEDEDEITYTKVSSSSQRGQDKLFDSLGFSYTKKRATNSTVHWRCSVRNKLINCKASSIQNATEYSRLSEHNHPPGASVAVAARISTEVKKRVKENVFRSAAAIVEEVMHEQITDENMAIKSVPAPDNLARQGNRARQGQRLDHPNDLHFHLETEFIAEGFFRKDISVDYRRHVIFATDKQVDILKASKRWYMDATFKVVFGIVESALWRALHSVLPDCSIHGCSFHWEQAVWRKELGLQTAYTSDAGTRRYIRKLLSLP